MNKCIILVGVGGQGTITTSTILSKGLIEAGFDVKMSEIHGMSQRGGTVVTQIKYGEKVSFLKEGGTIVTDVREINPMPVLTGEAEYPHEAIEQLKEVVPNVIVVEAAKVAEELGNVKAQNIVLLGALVKQLALDNVDWRDLIAKNVPAKTVDLNLAAFDKGYNM